LAVSWVEAEPVIAGAVKLDAVVAGQASQTLEGGYCGELAWP
jgi:hypothetical protein